MKKSLRFPLTLLGFITLCGLNVSMAHAADSTEATPEKPVITTPADKTTKEGAAPTTKPADAKKDPDC
ncbi:MAG: hypothetical protein ABL868_10600 [Sulfuriferula sp.]